MLFQFTAIVLIPVQYRHFECYGLRKYIIHSVVNILVVLTPNASRATLLIKGCLHRNSFDRPLAAIVALVHDRSNLISSSPTKGRDFIPPIMACYVHEHV